MSNCQKQKQFTHTQGCTDDDATLEGNVDQHSTHKRSPPQSTSTQSTIVTAVAAAATVAATAANIVELDGSYVLGQFRPIASARRSRQICTNTSIGTADSVVAPLTPRQRTTTNILLLILVLVLFVGSCGSSSRMSKERTDVDDRVCRRTTSSSKKHCPSEDAKSSYSVIRSKAKYPQVFSQFLSYY